MFFYGAAILVLLINKTGADTRETDTTSGAGPEHPRGSFNKGELAKLIHHVIDADNQAAEDDDNPNGERKLDAAERLDLDYFDIRLKSALKATDRDLVKLVDNNLVANQAHAANPENSDYAIRIHLIKNPEVIDQYRKNLMKSHLSTSSSSGYDDSLEYDRNIESFIRRNAVFRLGKPSERSFLRENPKFALRNGEDVEMENHKKNSREDNKASDFGRNDYGNVREKILVSFKDTKHDDYNDKPRDSDSKLHRNKNNYNDESPKKDMWDDITKNAYKWEAKKNKDAIKKEKYNEDYKNDNIKNTDDYKKKDGYGNYKKEKYDDYGSSNSKALKPKESKSNAWDKPKKDNSWDNWKSNSMERAESKQRNGVHKPKRSEKNDWDKPKKSEDWDSNKKNNDWDKPKKNNEWDKPKNDDNLDKPKKATKGISSYEREPKNEYFDKVDTKKKKTTNEWDRVVADSGGGSGVANKKPFVPKISDYYNPRPRIHENPAILGFKSFGRTSIPFVGKKGIYEEK